MTIVLLHMFAGSSRSWARLTPLLDRPWLAPDLRGFGAAPPPAPGATLDDWVDEMDALTAPLGDYVLVGHSMGGKIAMALAARQPPGLRGLLLVAPSPPTPEPIPNRGTMLDAFGDADAAAKTARTISCAAENPHVLQAMVGDSLRTAREAWEWWIRDGSRTDISAPVGTIAVPTRIVVGEQDTTLPPDLIARQVAARIAGASLSTVSGSRHMLPLDRPDALAHEIACSVGCYMA